MWSLGHVCAPGEDYINCHCDWRVEIYKCQEETALYYIIIVNMIISSLGFILGKLLLYLIKAFCGKYTQSVKTLFWYASYLTLHSLGSGIIYYRVILKGRQFFEINLSKGCLRPKPIDSMLLLLTIFNMRKWIIHISPTILGHC